MKGKLFIISVNCVTENFTQTLIKMKRQTLFSGTTATGFCSRGDRLGSTQINKEKWKFIAKEQGGGGGQ